MTRKSTKTLRIQGKGEAPTIIIENLEEFVDLSTYAWRYPPLAHKLRKAIKEGKFDNWLREIGEHNFADILNKFKGTVNLYPDAVGIINNTLKRDRKGFETVVGYEGPRRLLMERTVFPDKFEEISKVYGKKSTGAVLLYGPPGCGKTALANALAGETDKFFVKRNVLEIAECQKTLGNTFKILRKLGASVLFIDEIEALAINRDYEGMSSRMFANALLTEINNSEENDGVVVIGATNSPWLIDTAMLRSGRFDSLEYVGVPCPKTREDLFRFYSKELPLDVIDIRELARKTDFYSCSDIMAVCQEAAAIPWREALSTGTSRKITQEDFEIALKHISSTAIPWFETAASTIIHEHIANRFRPMMKEIERYKEAKEGSANGKWGGCYV